jgi:hypothetical protein
MIEWGVISDNDVNLFQICDSPEEAFVHLTAAIEQAGQYPGYHK